MAFRHDIVTDPFTSTFIKIKAAQLCRRSDFSRSDYDDLCQGMWLYLLEKLHLFDPARGNFEAFVTNVVNTRVGLELRYRARYKRCGDFAALSLEGTALECDGEADMLRAVIGEADQQRRTRSFPTSPIDLIDLADAVRNAFGNLGRREQELLKYVAEHGVAGAARKRGVSRRQIENAIVRMRSRFEDAGLGNG